MISLMYVYICRYIYIYWCAYMIRTYIYAGLDYLQHTHSKAARFLEHLKAPEFPQLVQLCYPPANSEISKYSSLIQSYFRMQLPNGASSALSGTNGDAQVKVCEDGVCTTDLRTKLIIVCGGGSFHRTILYSCPHTCTLGYRNHW